MALFEPARSKRQLAAQLVWPTFWLIVTGIAVWLHPNGFGHGTHQQLGFPPCPTVLIFDRPCPGCGMTTSWSAIVHGDFGLAFRAHPLGPPTYLLFTLSALACARGSLTGRRFVVESKVVNWGALAAGALFLAFGVWRALTTVGYAEQVERGYLVHQNQ
jgi:hypothetical protein